MDADRIATIRRRIDAGYPPTIADSCWLLDALETAQAEVIRLREVSLDNHAIAVAEFLRKEAERDAVQAENTRLNERVDDLFIVRDAIVEEVEELEAERDRLTNQITDLRLYLDKVANTAFGSNSAGLRLLRAEARDLLARCSTNEETAEEKKSRCKFCGSTEDGPIGTDGLMVCPDCAAEATT